MEWVRGVTRRKHPAAHPPTHSALRAGPRCWQSSEYRASPAPRFSSEGRGRGTGGKAGAALVPRAARNECSLHIDSATPTTAPAPPPVFINLVTGKARYSEPCLSRGPARSAEWVGGSARRGARNGWVAPPGAERGMGGWVVLARDPKAPRRCTIPRAILSTNRPAARPTPRSADSVLLAAVHHAFRQREEEARAEEHHVDDHLPADLPLGDLLG